MAKKLMNREGRAFKQLARELALTMVEIGQCLKCGHPYCKPYICQNCGDANPYEPFQTPRAKLERWLIIRGILYKDEVILKLKELGFSDQLVDRFTQKKQHRWCEREVLQVIDARGRS